MWVKQFCCLLPSNVIKLNYEGAGVIVDVFALHRHTYFRKAGVLDTKTTRNIESEIWKTYNG